MALPSSGTLSIGDIRSELSNTGTTSFALSKAGMPLGGNATRGDGYTPKNQNSTSKPNDTSPYQVSEWYSYNHTQNGSCNTTFYANSLNAQYLYYRINFTGTTGDKVSIQVQLTNYAASNTYKFGLYSTYPFNSSGTLTGGTLLTTLSFTANGTQAYLYTLASSSDVVYMIAWNDSVF